MKKNQKKIVLAILCAFIFGMGVLAGWLFKNQAIQYVVIVFFAFIGLVVLAVLATAVVLDSGKGDDIKISKPDDWHFDKRIEED